MRWSRALSAGVAITVVALAVKGAALSRPEPIVDTAGFLSDLSGRLRGAGFAAAIDARGFVIATRGACRMKVRELPPVGTERLAYERLSVAYGPTRYVWRGQWGADPPKYRPLMAWHLQRLAARVGQDVPRAPIVAVAGGAACAGVSAEVFDVASYQRRTP